MAIDGSLIQRSVIFFGAVAGVFVTAVPVSAASEIQLNIPAGRADQSIIALGKQADVSIGLADPALGSIRVHGVRGRMDVTNALRVMLKSTTLWFVIIDGRTFKVSALPRSTAKKTAKAPKPQPIRALVEAPTELERPSPDIIVTASKRDTNLSDFPGSISVVTLDARSDGTAGYQGSSEIINRMPVLTSTSLGAGRNKLFIRGVADSSFNGPTQATVGQYLGETRLTYNAPDPDLNLYDIKTVEILEGPQGTLYGAGSLGGIIRLGPSTPDLGNTIASVGFGRSVTAHGEPGYDAAAMVNLPIVDDRIGLRVVGYRLRDGGYIDDSRRNLKDINRTTTSGGRAMARIKPGDDWMIDLNWVRQDIRTRDGQYSERGLPNLTRASAIAQPFDNDYQLYELAVRKNWSAVSLVSSTSAIRHNLATNFDATSPDALLPVMFRQDVGIKMFTHETRLTRKQANGQGWLVGLSLLYDDERLTRTLGDVSAPKPLAGVDNEVVDLALFGEWTFGIAPDFNASIGGRIAYSAISSQLIALRNTDEFSFKDRAIPFLPHVALSWKPINHMLVFARYHEGFRTGGLSIASTGSADAVTDFASDTISSYEVGARYGDPQHDRLSATATLSYARWENIQADLVDSAGFPYSTNIGSGRVLGFGTNVTWHPTSELTIETSAFLNDSVLNNPAPGFGRAQDNDLPNTARIGGRIAATWAKPLSADIGLSINGSLRYVGRSYLGVGTLLDIPQGKYTDSAIDFRLTYKGLGFVLGMSNLFDAKENRFSFGNPFGVTKGLQQTPLRPRTIRIGIDAAF